MTSASVKKPARNDLPETVKVADLLKWADAHGEYRARSMLTRYSTCRRREDENRLRIARKRLEES